jgi:hypothetical protein
MIGWNQRAADEARVKSSRRERERGTGPRGSEKMEAGIAKARPENTEAEGWR